MKKTFLLLSFVLLAGCADILGSTGSSVADSSSTRSRMHSCMLTEAQSRLQAGTLFANPITTTAKDLASTCMKKLALESMGISEQSQSDAANIITQLKNLAG